MKKFAIIIFLFAAVVAVSTSSCTTKKKTIGCPGMISKANATTKTVRS